MNKKVSIATLSAFLVATSPAMAVNEANTLYVNLELSLNRTTVGLVIQSISEQTGYEFSYDESILSKEISKVSVRVKNEHIESVLKKVFKNTDISYRIVDNRIFLQDNAKTENVSFASVQQVKRTIRGTVVDNTGLPVIGANVIVKGSAGVGTVTNVDGDFTLEGIEDGATLMISYIGYVDQEVAVAKGKNDYKITIHEDTQNLDEVVVVGYGTQTKVNLTGAVSTIGKDELINRPVTNVSSALQGLTPGVTITSGTGQPGSDGSTIRVRGVGTLNNANPYILVDGIETGTFDSIDPNDIESISVLKDAASAAIYGSRAANGVILVTTKNGGDEKLSVTVNSSVAWQRFTDLPEFVNGYTYMKAMNTAYENVKKTPLYSDSYLADYMRYKLVDPDRYPDTDWQDALYTGSGFMQHHHISVSGGKKVNTLASFGYQEQEGLIPGFSAERYNMRLNSRMNIRKNLQAKVLVEARRNNVVEPISAASIMSNVNRIAPIYTARLKDGRWGTGYNNGNPVAQANDGGSSDKTYDFLRATFQVAYQPFSGMDVEFNFSPKFSNNYTKNFNKSLKLYTPDSDEPVLNPAMSSLNQTDAKITENMLQVILRYNKEFRDHEIGILGGYEQIIYKTQNISLRREGFPLVDYPVMNAGSVTNWSNGGGASEWALLSYFARANYSYKSRYLLEANIRVDGSSRFARGHRFGVFPSVSLGWRISEENFMKSVDWVTNLKLRASWGQLGNQEIGTYPAYTTMSMGPTFIFGTTPTAADGAVQKSYANEGITWETSETIDVGLDVSLFRNKFNMVFDLYERKTKDILLKLPITGITGLTEPYQNAGVVRNRGWDLELSHRNQHRDFRYQISFNLSDVHNKVIDLKGAGPIISGFSLIEEGYPINSIYGYKALGLFRSDEEIAGAPRQTFGDIAPGDIRYANVSDRNNKNTVDRDDRTVIGNVIPRYTYGLNIAMQYKGFDLSMLIQGVGKVNAIYTGDAVWALYNAGKMQRWHMDYWTPQNPGASYPRLIADSSHNNFQNSSFWVYDASYVRLKNAQLGYTLPERLTRKIWIQKLRLYVSGDNLLTFDHMPKGWDPETRSGDAEIYPIASTYTFGVQITF